MRKVAGSPVGLPAGRCSKEQPDALSFGKARPFLGLCGNLRVKICFVPKHPVISVGTAGVEPAVCISVFGPANMSTTGIMLPPLRPYPTAPPSHNLTLPDLPGPSPGKTRKKTALDIPCRPVKSPALSGSYGLCTLRRPRRPVKGQSSLLNAFYPARYGDLPVTLASASLVRPCLSENPCNQ